MILFGFWVTISMQFHFFCFIFNFLKIWLEKKNPICYPETKELYWISRYLVTIEHNENTNLTSWNHKPKQLNPNLEQRNTNVEIQTYFNTLRKLIHNIQNTKYISRLSLTRSLNSIVSSISNSHTQLTNIFN